MEGLLQREDRSMIRRSPLEFSDGAAGPLPGPDDDWALLAECQYTDPEIFFPEKGGSTREAKSVCRSCVVRSDCLEFALETGQMFGIWGGLSERERRHISRQAGREVAISAPRMCQKGLHVMDAGNTGSDGSCRACKKVRDARSHRNKHPLALGRGRTAEPRQRGKGGRFTPPQPAKKLVA